MSTVAELRSRTAKELAAMAKQKGVSGWHSMRKDQLVDALAKLARAATAKSARKASTNGKHAIASPHAGNGKRTKAPVPSPTKSPRTLKRLSQIKAQLTQSKDLSYTVHAGGNGNGNGNGDSHQRDRLVVMVRGPFWLHAYWELTRGSVERSRVALGQNWHGAKPILRLSEVARDGVTSTVRNVIRDIEIHGGVNNWYIDVQEPPKSYQVDIGYLANDGRFLCLARSNVVNTPQAGSNEADGNWAEVARDFDRIYALSGGYSDSGDASDLKDLFEERLRRPMGSPMMTRFGLGASAGGHIRREFPFDVDAELVVYGVTDPSAHVTLKGEPVRLQADGTFQVRFSLPDRRQVLPVVASSSDGVEQRTIVLAVERNTKRMEPVIREPDE